MNVNVRLRKAVFPVAGYGTRFLPATKVNPKEMLPVVDKPLIQYATEEAIAAGIDTLIFINGKNKRAIEDHYDATPELSHHLDNCGKHDLSKELEKIKPANVTCVNVRQDKAKGLGDAILCAERVIDDEPFVVLLADDLMLSDSDNNVTKDLLDNYAKYQATLLCVEHIKREQVDKYGIIAGKEISEGIWQVEQLIEKPSPANAPSQIGVIGRYVLQPTIFDSLRKIAPGVGGEVQLTDAIADVMQSNLVYACLSNSKRYDCGSKEGYLKANVEVGMQHAQIGDVFREYLKSRISGES